MIRGRCPRGGLAEGPAAAAGQRTVPLWRTRPT